MREHLFRGKTEAGEWVEGDLSVGRDEETNEIVDVLITKRWHSLYSYEGYPAPMVQDIVEEVIPETVGEWTGIWDDSEPKKRIFEGDVINFRQFYHRESGKGAVFYNEDDACYGVQWVHPGGLAEDLIFVEIASFVKIGNIHDNPELLEDMQ